MKLQTRLYEILEEAKPGDRLARAVHFFILALIVTNVVAVILESIHPLRDRFHADFLGFEKISIAIFTVEYGLRIWACTVAPRYASPFWGRVKFVLTPLALVDLLAVAPFYVPFVVADFRVVRAIRLFRFVRVLKFGRYSEAFRVLGRVLRDKRQELFATFTVVVTLLIIGSVIIYEAEHIEQPEKFGSIPAAMWWVVATLTTVGYGDIYPITGLGKLLASLIALLGIGMVALPTGIISAGFIEEVQMRKAATTVCPHCGKQVNSG
jgi:voltage-gated potassium channel